jgi:non-canonical poly(A) RNA polymerase PAPD5/7
MQPSRTRLICRARNRFNPSIALWQHFVEASLSKPRDRRQLSTATQVAQHATNANSKDTGAESPRLPEARNPRDAQVASKMAAEKAGAEPLPFRKMTTVKGRWLPSKVEAAIAKNVKAQQANHQTSKAESEKLLADARGAFAKSESYKGVVVKPMVSKTLIKESALPWCLKKEDRTAVPGLDR